MEKEIKRIIILVKSKNEEIYRQAVCVINNRVVKQNDEHDMSIRQDKQKKESNQLSFGLKKQAGEPYYYPPRSLFSFFFLSCCVLDTKIVHDAKLDVVCNISGYAIAVIMMKCCCSDYISVDLFKGYLSHYHWPIFS